MEKVEVIVIGAGVVGLAVARELAQQGKEVLILEAEQAMGSVTTARNSGVIHGGMYYKPGSMKATACVEGRKKLYAYAEERGVPHQRCGKIVVATAADQVSKLEQLKKTGDDNGVSSLRIISKEQVAELEPNVFCVAAMHSPETGIIDVHAYLLALLGDAEEHNAILALNAPVTSVTINDGDFAVEVGGASAMTISCSMLINSAGLGAQGVAHNMAGLDPLTIPPLILAKGSYFSMSGKPPFKMLIYPMPGIGSLGLHATCDLGGRIRFGPDIEWVDHIDYRVDPNRLPQFEEAIRHYYPGLPPNALHPDYSGVRPKLAKASPYDTDFLIQTEQDHKIPGLINLYGIESPGLTSSLHLAVEVASRLG